MSADYRDDEVPWIEVGTKETPHLEGTTGNLSDEQRRALHEMWQAYFSICERATGSATQAVTPLETDDDYGIATNLTMEDLWSVSVSKQDGDEARREIKVAKEKKKMKALLKTYGKDALRNTFWSFCRFDDPDATMLRFLRARSFNVEKAINMLAAVLKFRLDVNIDHLIENGDLGNMKEFKGLVENQAIGKVYVHGCDTLEQPICYVELRKHSIMGQASDSMKKFIISQMETWRLLYAIPSERMSILFDCSGFGFKNLDVSNMLYVMQCCESYFPETLATLYLHKAPWVLISSWNACKGLLDPVVQAKVKITKTDEELRALIPSDRLLSFVGGDVESGYSWVPPSETENDLLKSVGEKEKRWTAFRSLAERFERATKHWVQSGSQPTATELRRILAKRLRLAALELEAFTRGKTIYHRLGNLCPANPGLVVWHYTLKSSGLKIRQIVGQRQCKKTLVRELQEIEQGATVEQAEGNTLRLLRSGTWGRWDTLGDLPVPGASAVATHDDTARSDSLQDFMASSSSVTDTDISIPFEHGDFLGSGNGSHSHDDDGIDMNSFSDFAFTPSATEEQLGSILSPLDAFRFASGSPAIAHVEGAGSDTIEHVFASVGEAGGGQDTTDLEWADDQQAAARIAEFFASTNLDVPAQGELAHDHVRGHREDYS